MSYYSSRQYELDLSRKIALERQLEYSRAIQSRRIVDDFELKHIREVEKVRADQEFQEYQLRRVAEQQAVEAAALRERILREEKQKQYEMYIEAERRSRIQREEEAELQRRVSEEAQRRKTQALAASRRVEFEKQIRIKEEIQRENTAVLQEQEEQKKLQKELRSIDLEIGSNYDARDQRKRLELVELEKLDEQSFKLKQELRGSKVRQLALEESLANLSKIIV